jgi:hypothetical protein
MIAAGKPLPQKKWLQRRPTSSASDSPRIQPGAGVCRETLVVQGQPETGARWRMRSEAVSVLLCGAALQRTWLTCLIFAGFFKHLQTPGFLTFRYQLII